MIQAAARSRFSPPPSASPLAGVSAQAWERFAAALEVQAVGAVSASGGLGAYDMRPRRLVELGYASGLRYIKGESGRYIHTCVFIAPWTEERFLTDPLAQRAAFTKSMVLYHNAFLTGNLVRLSGVSVAGALCIAHRGGRGALEAWPELFSDTRVLYDAVKGMF